MIKENVIVRIRHCDFVGNDSLEHFNYYNITVIDAIKKALDDFNRYFPHADRISFITVF